MKISIVGQITDYKADGCFSPLDLKELLEGVSQDEPLEVEITSEGGSVFAGIQIANMLSRHNGLVATHAVGLCASIATVILMAGSKISVDENCFCLIHLPWSYCEGNALDMEKEIETLKKCEAAMMGYYRKHSKVDEELLSRYIKDETWFLGTEFADVFDCEVIACDQRFDIAAKCDLTKFNKIDKRILDMEKKDNIVSANSIPLSEVGEPVEEEVKVVVEEEEKDETQEQEVKEEVQQEETPVEEEKVEDDVSIDENKEEEQKEDPVDEEEDVEFLKARIVELIQENEELKSELAECEKPEEQEEMVSKDECEKRVSGMQSKMQAKINDFTSQLKVKDEELNTVKAELTSLNQRLEEANGELSNMASALEEKNNALAQLNAGVLRPAEELPTMKDGLAKCATPKERVDFLKSGKYVR